MSGIRYHRQRKVNTIILIIQTLWLHRLWRFSEYLLSALLIAKPIAIFLLV